MAVMSEPAEGFISIGAVLIERARKHPSTTAVIFPDARWTYAELLEQAILRARAMHARGLRAGDVIGLAMDDGPEFIRLFLGATLCGVIPALFATSVVHASVLSPRLPFLAVKLFIASGREGRAFVDMLGEAHSLVDRAVAPTLHMEDAPFHTFLAAASTDGWDLETSIGNVRADQIAAVVFTSGVTGLPKTCPVSHRNLLCKAAPFGECFELEASARMWIGVRMFQIGFVTPFVTAIAKGASVIVAPPAFGPDELRAFLIAERVTHAYPIYLQNWLPIVQAPAFQPSDFPDLSHICLVGPTTALRRAQRAVPQAVIMNTYGSAEEAGAFCMPRSDDPVDKRLATSGRPFAGHEVRIVNPDSGVRVRTGAVGEIQVRGEGVPKPSLGNDFGSDFTTDGWLRTSDLGEIGEDRRLTYHGRLSEMLKIGDETVSAIKIETVLALHADVALAQVVGKPDSKLGEVPVAFIELRPGAIATAAQLVEFCLERLPPNHVPRYVQFVSDWPTTASKIYKPVLTGMHAGPRLVD
jgi:fatty-acyl-CoA synthase